MLMTISRRQIAKATTSTKDKSSNFEELPEDAYLEWAQADPDSPNSPPQDATDSTALEFEFYDMDLYADAESSPKLFNFIDDYSDFFLESTQTGLPHLEEEEEYGRASDGPDHSLSPVTCFHASTDQLLKESLLEDVPSWKKSLILHCKLSHSKR